jgi:hypothetical protein
VPLQVKQLRLCHNVLRSLDVSAGPPLERLPSAPRATATALTALLAFEEGDYAKAQAPALGARSGHPLSHRMSLSLCVCVWCGVGVGGGWGVGWGVGGGTHRHAHCF